MDKNMIFKEFEKYVNENKDEYTSFADYLKHDHFISYKLFREYGKFVRKEDYENNLNDIKTIKELEIFVKIQAFQNMLNFYQNMKNKTILKKVKITIEDIDYIIECSINNSKELLKMVQESALGFIHKYPEYQSILINNMEEYIRGIKKEFLIFYKKEMLSLSDNILSNNKLILQLEENTSICQKFSPISKEEKNNYSLLFLGILKYCCDNDICIFESNNQYCTLIKYNNIGYCISSTSKGLILCSRCEVSNNCIDFNDIINSKQDNDNKTKKFNK